ncbi:hypothetical protein SAY86_004676 [Trapa natans]|uniref:Uncharacterized protein n=1 Tax=Trapa natans TaxID=22666 RepID=A0AAN7RFR4_TRANT|nr:hypothetical protein SAY86_004676 [Trapa natans]
MTFKYFTFDPHDDTVRPGSPPAVFSFPSPDSPRVCSGCLGGLQQPKRPSRLRIGSAAVMQKQGPLSIAGSSSTSRIIGSQKLGTVDNPNEKPLMVFARDLSIIWGDTPQYWRWIKIKGMSGTDSQEETELVELQRVCWLEIRGRYETSELLPETTYSVIFEILIRANYSSGWEAPVNLRLVLPDGTKQEGKLNLHEQPKDKWLDIPAGEIRMASWSGDSEIIEFSMYETENLNWKSGLVVKGVRFQPRKQSQ